MWRTRVLRRSCAAGTAHAAAALHAAAAADGGRAVAAAHAVLGGLTRRTAVTSSLPLCGACRHAHSTAAVSDAAPAATPSSRAAADSPAAAGPPPRSALPTGRTRDADSSRTSILFGTSGMAVGVRACSAWVVRAQSGARQAQPHLLELASWPRLDRLPERVNLNDPQLLAAAERTWRNIHEPTADRWGLRVTDATSPRFLPSPFHYAFLLRAYSRPAFEQDVNALWHTVRLLDELLMQTSMSGTAGMEDASDSARSLQLFPASHYAAVMDRALRLCTPILSQSESDSVELRHTCRDIVQRLDFIHARATAHHNPFHLAPLCCVGADGLATDVPLALRTVVPLITSSRATSSTENFAALQNLVQNFAKSPSRAVLSADPHEAGATLLRLLETAVRTAQWEQFESLWGQLNPLLRSSVERALKVSREPASFGAVLADRFAHPALLRLDEIHRAFHLLALVSLRSSDPRAIQRGLLDAWSWPDMSVLRLVRVPDLQRAILWGMYLRRDWDAAMEMRAQAAALDCYVLDDAERERGDETVFQEFMLECLTRCALQEKQHRPHVHVSNPARSEAHQRLLTFAWAGAPAGAAAATAAAPRSPSSSLLSQPPGEADATKKELLALYANLAEPADSDPASAYRGSTAALRSELRDITRKYRLSMAWADARPDEPCPLDAAIDAQDAADLAAEEAKLRGLPPPPPLPRLPPRKKNVLKVVFHHYSTPSSIHGCMALLLRCLAVLEPRHGTPEVRLRMAPWRPPHHSTPDLPSALLDQLGGEGADLSSAEHDVSGNLYADFFSPLSHASASASAREREEAMLAWSGDELDQSAIALSVLTHTWATVLEVSEESLWVAGRRHVRLPSAPLARLAAALAPRGGSGGTLGDALRRLGMRPKLSLFKWREESAGNAGAASATMRLSSSMGSSLRLPVVDQQSDADRHYSSMRDLLRPGEQKIEATNDFSTAGTMQ